jgi:hypothetical protein
MKLKDYILLSVYNFPGLYLCETYEESRILVLNQLFLVNGNGMEWAKTKNPAKGGYLVSPKFYKKNGERLRKLDSPYGYEKFDIDWLDLMGYGITDEIVPTKIELERIKIKSKKIDFDWDRTFKNKNWIGETYDRNPYPHYDKGWPFYDVQNGNQKLEFIQPDWLEGMIEIKLWALNFYKNKEKYHNDFYYGSTERSVEECRKHIKNNTSHKDWKSVLNAYEIKTPIPEWDFKALVVQRVEDSRLKYIGELEYAIKTLKGKKQHDRNNL